MAVEPLCRYCADRGKTEAATVADHITPHKGDAQAFWANELQSLCATCHSGAKARLEATGRLPGCGLDGVPADPSHHWHGGGGCVKPAAFTPLTVCEPSIS